MKKEQKTPNQFRAYLAITWYSFRAQTRNAATFFFGFLFPIVFIGVFGLIGNSAAKVTVGIPNSVDKTNPIIQAVEKASFVKVNTDTQDNLEKQLKTGKIGGIITVSEGSKPHSYAVN